MTDRKVFILLGLVMVIGAAATWWVLITPDDPLTSLFRRQISDMGARIVIGPYPAERDFRFLKQKDDARFLSALRQMPDNADALGGLGLTCSRAGRRGEALSRLDAAITLTPDNQELRDVLERARASQ